MNSDFIQQQARSAAASLISLEKSLAIRKLYQRILSRNPSTQELQLATSYLSSGGLPQFAQVLMMSNEFLYVD